MLTHNLTFGVDVPPQLCQQLFAPLRFTLSVEEHGDDGICSQSMYRFQAAGYYGSKTSPEGSYSTEVGDGDTDTNQPTFA